MLTNVVGLLKLAECKAVMDTIDKKSKQTPESQITSLSDPAFAAIVEDRVKNRIAGFAGKYAQDWSRVTVNHEWKICVVRDSTIINTELNKRALKNMVAKVVVHLTSNYGDGELTTDGVSYCKPGAGDVLLIDMFAEVTTLPIKWGVKYLAISEIVS